jgi:L-asparaginase / beta-aspartyl-peptidase
LFETKKRAIPDDQVEGHLCGVHLAISQIYPKLLEGMSALDAVEQAINILENDPTFDAGIGSALNTS